MRSILSLFVFLVSSSPALLAAPFEGGDEVILMQWGSEDTELEFFTSRVALRQQRQWVPESEPPPLEIGDAIEVGMKEAARLAGTTNGVKLQGATLQQRLVDRDEGAWFYVLQFESVEAGARKISAYVAVVLLDGTVAPSRPSQR